MYNKKNIIIFISIIMITLSVYGGEKKSLYEDYISVSKKGITFSYRIEDNNLKCIVEAPTKGWISIGFDPTSKMKGADYVIGYVKDGKTFIYDHYGTGRISHKADIELGGTDNVTKISGVESDKHTRLSFSIPLDSGDRYDKPLGPGTHTLLLAYSRQDNLKSKHSVRTHLKIELKKQ